jgi:hypothetical protein
LPACIQDGVKVKFQTMAVATHREVQATIDVKDNKLTDAVVDAHLPTSNDIRVKSGYDPISIGPSMPPRTKRLRRKENWLAWLTQISQMIFWGDA